MDRRELLKFVGVAATMGPAALLAGNHIALPESAPQPEKHIVITGTPSHNDLLAGEGAIWTEGRCWPGCRFRVHETTVPNTNYINEETGAIRADRMLQIHITPLDGAEFKLVSVYTGLAENSIVILNKDLNVYFPTDAAFIGIRSEDVHVSQRRMPRDMWGDGLNGEIIYRISVILPEIEIAHTYDEMSAMLKRLELWRNDDE